MAATDIKNDASLGDGNLVSVWLTDSSGLLTDLHGSNDLTNNNTVTLTTGVQGDAGDFEATNTEWLSITDASQTGLDITGDISVAFWLKAESTTAGIYVSKDDASDRSFWFQIDGAGKTNCFFQDGSNNQTRFRQTTATVTDTATDYHIVMTIDVSVPSCTMYVDGSSVAVTTELSAATSIKNSATPFEIGRFGGNSNYVDGIINQVAIYSKILDATDASNLYNSGSGIPYEAATAFTPTMMIF